MSDVLSGRVSKHRRDRRVKNSTVLRMMAIMQEGNSEVPKEFLETGRTGRRNAMPDIMHPQGAEVTTADLPNQLQLLATDERVDVSAGPSTTSGEHLEVQQQQESRPTQTDS